MGGRCSYSKPTKSTGRNRLFIAKSCTDNFQIVHGKFNYGGLDWHSVEQAFQSLKFPIGSIAQKEIYNCAPRNPVDEANYGIHVWTLGQPRQDTKMRSDWEQEKVKMMLLLNLAKYSSNQDFQNDLLETENYRIIANESTANWAFWNAAIQTYIRNLLHAEKKLEEEIVNIEATSPEDVRNILKRSYEFNLKPDLFRAVDEGNFEYARHLYAQDPPPVDEGLISENTPLEFWNGKLILAGVHDFTSTFEQYKPDVVVTMCSKPPRFPDNAEGGEWLLRSFSGYDLNNYEVFGIIISEIVDRLQRGLKVLVHCIDGQDRTGIVAMTLTNIFRQDLSFDDKKSLLSEARPARMDYWFAKHGVMNLSSQYYRTAKNLADTMNLLFR